MHHTASETGGLPACWPCWAYLSSQERRDLHDLSRFFNRSKSATLHIILTVISLVRAGPMRGGQRAMLPRARFCGRGPKMSKSLFKLKNMQIVVKYMYLTPYKSETSNNIKKDRQLT